MNANLEPCGTTITLDQIYDEAMRDARNCRKMYYQLDLYLFTDEEIAAYQTGFAEGEFWKYNPNDRFSNTRVIVKHGSEGPRHDPYGYTILTVRRNGHYYEFKMGALYNSYIEVDDDCVMQEEGENFKELETKFEEITGYAPDQWMHWHEVLESRREPDPYGCLGDYE